MDINEIRINTLNNPPTALNNPLPNPPSSKNPVLKIGLITLLICLALIIAGFLLLNKPAPKSDKFLLSDSEWKNVKSDISKGYLFRAVKKEINRNDNEISSVSPLENFFQTAKRYAGLPPAPRTADSAAKAGNLSSFLIKFRLRGTIFNNIIKKTENYDLFISNLAAEDKNTNSNINDVLVNGQIGNLHLGDPDFDALHLSIVQPDKSPAYVKASTDDIFLIVLDRMLNGSDPESSKSGIISAKYEDVYPYFNRYVEVPDAAAKKKEIPLNIQKYEQDYENFFDNKFGETIANAGTYINRVSDSRDKLAAQDIIRVKTSVNLTALAEQVNKLFQAMDKFASDRKDDFAGYCQKPDKKAEKQCLESFGYYPDSKGNLPASALLNLLEFKKFDIIVGADNKEVMGFDLNLGLNKPVFAQLKKSLPDKENTLKNILGLEMDLAFSEMPPKNLEVIEKPSAYIRFLPDNKTKNLGKENPNNTEKLAEDLFRTNHQFVSRIWEEDLKQLNSIKKEYCQNKWKPAFCLSLGSDWAEDQDKLKKPDSMGFMYPSQRLSPNSKFITFNFENNEKYGQGSECKKDSSVMEIKTAGGLVFWAVKQNTSLNSDNTKNEDLVLDLCFQNTNGKLTTVSPLAKSIRLYAANMTLKELLDKTGEIIKSIKMNGPVQIDTKSDFSASFEKNEDYYLNNAKNDANACSISFFRDKNGFSQKYENLRKDFKITREFNNLIIPEKTAFCQDSTCLKCVKKSLEWTEPENCKGFTCNP